MNFKSSKTSMMVIVFALLVLTSSMAIAQMGDGNGKGNALNYFDPNTVTSVSGTLTEFLGLWSANGSGDCTGAGLHFTINDNGLIYYAMFGPFFYMEELGVELSDGMNVTLTGSVIAPHQEGFLDHDYLIVTAVTVGGTTYELRDENGMPLWAGAKKDGKGKGLYYNAPEYDKKTATNVTGTVLQVRTRTGGANADAALQLRIRTEDGARLRIHVSPQYFSEANDFSVAKGDTVKIRGSIQKRDMVASTINCDGDFLKLRDRKGNPLWINGQ